MGCVIRATTPTLKYTFKKVPVTDITQAYLSIARGDGTTVIEKSLEDATVGNGYIAWTLTQAETLSIAAGSASAMCNWLTRDGTRGASIKVGLTFERNYKEEVI